MTSVPLLVITNLVKHGKQKEINSILFYDKALIVETNASKKEYQYTDIRKIKMSTEYIKIILKNKTFYKITTTISEQEKLKEIFGSDKTIKIKNKRFSFVFIQFCDKSFIISISEPTIFSLKKSILYRIGSYLFPTIAIDSENLLVFENKLELIGLVNSSEIVLENDEDLLNLIKYCDKRITIKVTSFQ